MVRNSHFVVCACLVASSHARVAAADRNADFTAALRSRGWHDASVDYLDWVGASPLATEAFLSRLPLERAHSLAEQSKRASKRTEQSRMRLEAANAFEAYASSRPPTVETAQSLREATSLYASEALALIEKADRLPDQAADQRRELNSTAQRHFASALESVDRLLDSCTEQLAALPKAAMIQSDPAAKALRDQLRNLQAEGRFTAALLAFEQAGTFAPRSEEFTAAIGQAAAGFASLQEDYRDTLVGVSSRFYQGRCQQELGDLEKALESFHDLVSQPAANDEFRRWTARAYRHRMECLMALDKTADAIRDGESWRHNSRPSEQERPEWLGVAYRLAEAYLDQSKADGSSGGDAAKWVATSRSLFKEVAKTPNEFQADARLKLASLGQSGNADQQLVSFDDALEAGKTAVELMNSSQLALELAKENNPDAVAELSSQISASKDQARTAFQRAVELIDAQTPKDKVATLRSYLCWLYWEDERWQEAAITGEYILRRYPESPAAQASAKVALAAYEQLYRAARERGDEDGGRYEASRLENVAKAIMERWPQSVEASSSANLLVRLALEGDRFDEAERMLAQLPPQSRAAAQLSLGSALWTQSLQLSSAQGVSADAEVAALRTKARAALQQGFESVREETAAPSLAAAVGVLHLVQLDLAEKNWQGALSTLEDPRVGPLAIARGNSDGASRPEFILEAYKTALRVYLTCEPPRGDEARKTMQALEESVDESTKPQLTKVYISLGLQMEQKIKDLTASGERARAADTARAFAEIIVHVAERPDAQVWALQNWIAHANLQLGSTLGGVEARPFVERAQKAYQRILEQSQQDPKFAPDAAALLGVRKRLGDCLFELGEASQAYQHYVAILREKPNALELQEASAEALMAWGRTDRDVQRLDQAIRGAEPQKDGKKLVWGWLRIAQAADAQRSKLRSAASSKQDPRLRQFDDLFFKARLGVARARFMAASAAGPKDRDKQLKAALASIEVVSRLYPDMGGPQWKAEFEKLRMEIEKTNG